MRPGTRPASLAEPPGPQERAQRHTVEQLAEVAPVEQILDGPVPQTVVQLVDVLKIIDIPVPEQVIEVKIFSQDSVPQRVVLQRPQLVEQLVEVPVPFFRQCVIAETLREVVLARFRDSAGRVWCQCSGPGGIFWWLSGTRHTQWARPEGLTASPGRYTNTGQG